jgi:transposase
MYRPYGEPSPLLVGYDPCRDLPEDHLARLVELVVEETVEASSDCYGPGQTEFDPRLCVKVLIYGYATGVRSSRQLEKQCRENLPYLFLTRGDTPCYRTICSARRCHKADVERVWMGLFGVAKSVGLKRVGRIVVDTSKLRANASREMILGDEEYAALRSELAKILLEAEQTDSLEDSEGYAGETRTGKSVGNLQMRDIVRKVRSELSQQGRGAEQPSSDVEQAPKRMTQRMRERASCAISAIEQAESDGRKQLCLTDPDSRMMPSGVGKKLMQCHSLEVGIDRDCGLLVATGVTQIAPDNGRLKPLVERAKLVEPNGIKSVDGDSGFFSGEAIAELTESGIDTCIPDSLTACELHRGLEIGTLSNRCGVEFVYDEAEDLYRCPAGNMLTLRGEEAGAKRYRAQRNCVGCALYGECLRRGGGKPIRSKYKQMWVRLESKQIRQALDRFKELEHRQRYKERACAVEGVFGFIKGVLGYRTWLLRGAERVENEGKLISLAYQLRRMHRRWATTRA